MSNFPKKTLELSSHSEGAMAVSVHSRDLVFHIDEPASHGGTNLGPSPVECAVAALSSCVSIIIRVIARRHGYQIEAVSTAAKAEMDMRGIMFMEETAKPFVSVVLDIQLTADLADDELAVIREEVRKFCPLYRLFSAAGTEIVENWSLHRTATS